MLACDWRARRRRQTGLLDQMIFFQPECEGLEELHGIPLPGDASTVFSSGAAALLRLAC